MKGINIEQLGIATEMLKEDISKDMSSLQNVVNKVSIAQKTVNTNLDCAFLMLSNSYRPVLNQTIPFVKKSGNMDVADGVIKLKPYKTYEFIIALSYAEPNTAVAGNIQYNLEINGSTKHIFSPHRGTLNYEMSSVLVFQYYNDSDTEVNCRLFPGAIYQTDTITHTVTSFSIKEIGREITIDPVSYVNNTGSIEDTPVGHILSQMGTAAPKHYLICDGAIYNITDYPYLSQYIKDQFGSFNHFGGDGINTFAVPDLRGEFLRGTGTGARNTGSGAVVGNHQDGTVFPNLWAYSAGSANVMAIELNKAGENNDVLYPDRAIMSANRTFINMPSYATATGVGQNMYAYNAKPTNTSVLYCIKYEPTYFMSIQGMIEDTVLWEGNIGTTSKTSVKNTINLSNSIMNYDKIGIRFNAVVGGQAYLQYQEIVPDDIKKITELAGNTIQISLIWGFGSEGNFSSILYTSTLTSLSLAQAESFITQVIGIKYKTFQNENGGSGGSCDCEGYTNEEIETYIEEVLDEVD